MRRSRLVWAAAILGLVALVLLTPTTEDPDATRAVRRFLANLGHEVAETRGAPAGGGTLIILADLRGPDEARGMLDWAESGGHLVVTDPTSAVVELAGASIAGPIGFAGTLELEPGCVTAVTKGVDGIVARASDTALVATDDAFVACFPTGDGALLLTRQHGAGRVTLLGGSSALTNGLLPEADNAVLAAQLAGPSADLAFADPGSPAGAVTGTWEHLPERARAALVAIAAAGVAFALVRARRLGAPVLEEPVAPIPASELVRAAGRMLRRTHASADAGRVLRDASIAELSRRLRVAGENPDVPSALARATGMPEAEVAAVLVGPEPRTDDELINLGRDLEALARRAEQGSR
jgi:hypothetical protein